MASKNSNQRLKLVSRREQQLRESLLGWRASVVLGDGLAAGVIGVPSENGI